MTGCRVRIRSGLACAVLAAAGIFAGSAVYATDVYDAAVAHPGRSAADLKRDPLDRPADILRLAGIKPGMQVVDFLAGDGYYAELLSYVVGPRGHVLLLNNPPFEKWAENGAVIRTASNRLPNVDHQVVDLDHLDLPAASLDAVFLVKVYHDLYWVDTEGQWPKVNTSAVLDQIARAIKHGGVVVIVDHSAKAGAGASVASSLHRIDEAYARKDWETRGLKLVGKSDALRRPDDARDHISYKPPALGKTDRFVLVFRK